MATNKAMLDQIAQDDSSFIDLHVSVSLHNRYLGAEQRRAITALIHEHARTLQAALGLVAPNRHNIWFSATSSSNGTAKLSLLNEVTDDVVDNEE